MPVATQQRVKIDLTNLPAVTNDLFYPLYWDDHRWLILWGGAGSGKSEFAAMKLLVRVLSEPRHRLMIVRKTAKTHRTTTWLLFRDLIFRHGWERIFQINKSDLTITCRNGAQIFFLGMDDTEKLKSFVKPTAIWCEETNELSLHDVIQLNLRLRGETESYKQIILSFNPISSKHWLKARFFDNPPGEHKLKRVHSTHKDNRFIDDEYHEELEELASLSANQYTIYALGEWGTLQGVIYSQPEVVSAADWPVENYLDDSVPDEKKWRWDETIYGMDFGSTNPTTLIRIDIKDGKVWESELLYETGMTHADIVNAIPRLVNSKTAPIFCDSAEPAAIKAIHRAGYNAQHAYKGRDSVKAGITFCQSLKRSVREGSTNLLTEYATYSWREDREGKPLEEPVKRNDHAMDAVRYAEFTHLFQRHRDLKSRNTLAGFGIFT